MKIQSIKLMALAALVMLGGIATAQSYNMDVTIQYDNAMDTAEVKWYPGPNPNRSSFGVVAYGSATNYLTWWEASADETSMVLEGVEASDVALLQVYGLDLSWNTLDVTPLESISAPPAPVAEADKVAFASPCGLNLSLETLDSGAFPMLYATVKLSSNGNPVASYTKDDFEVYEDYVLQTELFDVTPPGSNAGVRIADIVFLIDESGSMGNEIAAVKANAQAFADALVANNIDFRLGLVQFGGNSPNPGIIGGGLTDDVNEFKSWITSYLVASGSYEPGYEAISLALQNYNFRPGAQKHFILVSDEDSDGSLAGTIALALSNQVKVHTYVDPAFGYTQDHYSGPNGISAQTGGRTFLVTADFSDVINEIGTILANTYIVRYKSSNPLCDGTTRLVEIVATNPADSNCYTMASTTYTPCGAPFIIRTPDTVALHDVSHSPGDNLVIAAKVQDYVAPFVQGVTLFVRTSGTTAWSQVPMPLTGGTNIYSATIPVGLVNEPGVDYYIRATDGNVAATRPANTPAGNPYQLAVLPNTAPVITHVPPVEAEAGNDVALTADAQDSTDGLVDFSLFYRATGEILYKQVQYPYNPMQPSVSEVFVIPAADVVVPSIEYYFTATDNRGVSAFWGSATADKPHTLPVYEDLTPPMIISASATPNPAVVGETVTFSVNATDAVDTSLDVVWDFGDGTPATTDTTHAYAAAGSYKATVTVTDDAGNSASKSITVVVADNAIHTGFVFGWGCIDSPKGAYAANSSVSGEARFVVQIKYKDGEPIPVGRSGFNLQAGSLKFVSTSYESLVVSPDGKMAEFGGEGWANGKHGYKFKIWMDDGIDAFRLRIWKEDAAGNETTIYDNGSKLAIWKGGIVIKKENNPKLWWLELF